VRPARFTRTRFAFTALIALGTASAACGTTTQTSVLVSAASSLSIPFGEIEAAFEARHPDIDIVLNLAGSSALREQILDGSPTDVFASANPSNMDAVADMLSSESVAFARNRLQLAVPQRNPGGVSGLSDLERGELLVGLCAQQVPCGSVARAVLAAAEVEPNIDTNEPDARALLAKLEAGELDVGMVYATDVFATTEVIGIEIPDEFDRSTEYLIAPLNNASNPTAASDFVAFVLSAEGQAILTNYGFESP
jgi:molybdate transport system substrate-binding protein